MRQLALRFPDDEGTHSVGTLTPAEAAAIREHELEQALAIATPEERQRHWARVAAEARRRVLESRRPR